MSNGTIDPQSAAEIPVWYCIACGSRMIHRSHSINGTLVWFAHWCMNDGCLRRGLMSATGNMEPVATDDPVAKEREECARIADEAFDRWQSAASTRPDFLAGMDAATQIAAAILARGK